MKGKSATHLSMCISDDINRLLLLHLKVHQRRFVHKRPVSAKDDLPRILEGQMSTTLIMFDHPINEFLIYASQMCFCAFSIRQTRASIVCPNGRSARAVFEMLDSGHPCLPTFFDLDRFFELEATDEF